MSESRTADGVMPKDCTLAKWLQRHNDIYAQPLRSATELFQHMQEWRRVLDNKAAAAQNHNIMKMVTTKFSAAPHRFQRTANQCLYFHTKMQQGCNSTPIQCIVCKEVVYNASLFMVLLSVPFAATTVAALYHPECTATFTSFFDAGAQKYELKPHLSVGGCTCAVVQDRAPERAAAHQESAKVSDDAPQAPPPLRYRAPTNLRFCWHCGPFPTSDTELKYCAKCRFATYCSLECHNADWPTHKSDCSFARHMSRRYAVLSHSVTMPAIDQLLCAVQTPREPGGNLRKVDIFETVLYAWWRAVFAKREAQSVTQTCD